MLVLFTSALAAQTPFRVELHVHLDGSMESDTLFEIATARNLSLPLPGGEPRIPSSADEIEALLAATTPSWHKFDIVNDIVGGDSGAIALAASAFVERQVKSLVRYTEVRYDPVRLQRTSYASGSPPDLTGDEVVKAVALGLRTAMARHEGIVVNQILCAMRGSDAEACESVAELAARQLDLKAPGSVVGLDLAGDEAHFSNAPYIQCFKDFAGPKTVHAGEGFGNLPVEVDDMFNALTEMGVQRIGHGYASANGGVQNKTLVDLIRSTGVHLEACPKSAWLEATGGLQAGAFAAIGEYQKAGLNFGISTDDPASQFGNTSMLAVEELVIDKFGWTQAEILASYDRACGAAFGRCEKQKLL